MKEAVIVACGRSAIGKAPSGKLKHTRPEELASQVLRGLLDRNPGLKDILFDDLVLGCAFPEGEQGINLARLVVAKAGLSYKIPGQTVNRFCSSGLQSIATAAFTIMAGQAEAIIAGGVEAMSVIPMGGSRFVPDPTLIQEQSEYFMAMGHTAERVAAMYKVSREEQDVFSVQSHQKASAARRQGLFKEQIIPVQALNPDGVSTTLFEVDEGIRDDSSLEGLSKLRAPFTNGGTVTAGNSSQTSDGAAFTVVMEKAKALSMGLKPMAKILSFAVAGVKSEVMGIGPIEAIPKALKYAGLKISDINLVELNEAFADQALPCIKELGLNPDIVNIHGGAIALGHPLGCTGSALTTKLLYAMKSRGDKYGVVSMCIGGGQGAAAVFEAI
jgi:acetyl-CoA acyltransferase